MENNQLSISQSNTLEQVIINGDLSKLSPAERVNYYRMVCESIGLNPFTKPFDYIQLNGKLTLYAKKDATDQLRSKKSVSIDDVEISEIGDSYVVKVKGHDSTGRCDVEIGVVKKSDMQGNSANAQMKAVTKAKRRLTLSLCGLGWLDETEIETIPSAKTVGVTEEGEIQQTEAPKAPKPPYPGDEILLETFEYPDDFSTMMTIEDCYNVVGSDGIPYTEKDNKSLFYMLDAMEKRLVTNHLTQAEKDQLNDKRAAIYLIWNQRKEQAGF